MFAELLDRRGQAEELRRLLRKSVAADVSRLS